MADPTERGLTAVTHVFTARGDTEILKKGIPRKLKCKLTGCLSFHNRFATAK